MLGNLPVPGRPTISIAVEQGPIALAVGAGGGCLDIFTLIYPFSSLSPSLWETARYRLKYCLKGPLNPKQPTNQPTITPGHMNYLALRRIKVHIPKFFPFFLVAQGLSVGSQSQLEWKGQGTWLCHLQINGPWILPDPEGH